MNDLINRLAGLPFAPLITWASDGGQWLGIGLGDLLLAAVFPLVMRKAFGRTAGLLALGLGLATLMAMLALLDLRVVRVTLPAMVALGRSWWRSICSGRVGWGPNARPGSICRRNHTEATSPTTFPIPSKLLI